MDRKRIIRVNRLLLITVLAQFTVTVGVLVYVLLTLQSLNTFSLLLSAQASILVPTILYLLCFHEEDKNIIPHKEIGIATILIIILLGISIIPGISFINMISMLFTKNEIAATIDGMYEMSLGVKLFAIALLPAIGEELLFRGVIYGSYRKKGVVKALLLSSFLFGLMHMNLNQFLYATILGFIMVLLMEATGSILAPIVLHFIYNGLNVLMSHFVTSTDGINSTRESIMESIVSYFPVALIATIIAVGFFILLMRQNHSLEKIKSIFRGGYAAPGNYANPKPQQDTNSAVTFRRGNLKGYKHDNAVTYLNGMPYYGEDKSESRSFSYVKPFHAKDYSLSSHNNSNTSYKMNGHTYNGNEIVIPQVQQQLHPQSTSPPLSAAGPSVKAGKENSVVTASLIVFIIICVYTILSSQFGIEWDIF